MRKGVLAALAGAAALAAAGQAAATTVFNVDFTIASNRWGVPSVLPYGLTDIPASFTGTFTLDLSRLGSLPENGAETLTAFSFQLGSKTYSLSNVNFADSSIARAPNGEPNGFFLRLDDGSIIANYGAVIGDGLNYLSCVQCVATHGMLQPGAIPEPASWAMMLLGFLGLGAATRMRRRSALA